MTDQILREFGAFSAKLDSLAEGQKGISADLAALDERARRIEQWQAREDGAREVRDRSSGYFRSAMHHLIQPAASTALAAITAFATMHFGGPR